MAEAAAAFYAVETVAEGAVVGAVAVSQSTTPINLRFRKLGKLPPTRPWTVSVGASLSVVKGKAYVFGGEVDGSEPDTSMKVITLPSDVENGEIDYKIIDPDIETERPLQKYSSATTQAAQGELPHASTTEGSSPGFKHYTVQSRSHHVSTSIESDIFILAGRAMGEPIQDQAEQPDGQRVFKCDHVYSFSTQTNKWSIIQVDVENCKAGLPEPRTGASCTSTTHPQPDMAVKISARSHGTIFLHGGYGSHGQLLRDTWAFDVSSKTWTRFPDLPNPSSENFAGEGRITCVERRLWRAGDGFGEMMYIDFDIVHDSIVGETSGPHYQATGVQAHSPEWEVVSFKDQDAAQEASKEQIGTHSENSLTEEVDDLPVPRKGAGLVPISSGAGRHFLLYFMGEDGPGSVLGDIWSFQIKAEEKTLAAMKDAINSVMGKETGENKWARCQVVESTMNEGQIQPLRGLAYFAADGWKDLGGGNILLWGGIDLAGQPSPELWIMSVI